MTTRTEWITCNACGADDIHPLGSVDEWFIGECRRCSLVYVNPVPVFEPSPEFSRLSLDFQYTRFQHEVGPEVVAHDARQFRRQAELAAERWGRGAAPGRFLDVGCGSGATIRAATDQGWDATGVDLDPALVEIGRARLGANIRTGTLPDPTLPSGAFDFVRLRDVIEHLPNPYAVLLDIRRILAPGGVLLVATPNEGSLPTRARAAFGVPRARVATVAPPHHLHGFTPDTLRRILVRAGLQPVEVTTTTPVDATYVTSRNMQLSSDPLRVALWTLGSKIGMGSMLVAWAQATAAERSA